MRLSSAEIEAIVNVVGEFMAGASAKLYLFGSRADDSKKGGDIDLALVCRDKVEASKISFQDYKILSKFKAHAAIGEQKIDLKIISESDLSKPFFVQALKGAVLIKSY
ncbi:MAG: nucleotidyltransferase domain-containing protein [Bdellovibrionales bacterium]|nr:nucleotidyltransferase domain-containing protein [Bdellovibrionales bacterium]